jgi:hypothetical protein
MLLRLLACGEQVKANLLMRLPLPAVLQTANLELTGSCACDQPHSEHEHLELTGVQLQAAACLGSRNLKLKSTSVYLSTSLIFYWAYSLFKYLVTFDSELPLAFFSIVNHIYLLEHRHYVIDNGGYHLVGYLLACGSFTLGKPL